MQDKIICIILHILFITLQNISIIDNKKPKIDLPISIIKQTTKSQIFTYMSPRSLNFENILTS